MMRAASSLLLTCVLAAGQAPDDDAAVVACTRHGAENGTCGGMSGGTKLLQSSSQALQASSDGCPVSEYTDLYVTSCGDGYALPSWTDSTLNADCVDGLSFGREIGMICRNEDLNVGKGIIVVHGSGSDRTDMWSRNGGWGNLFLRRGYVVFSIDYSATGDCEVDIAAASAFLQDPANLPSADFAVDAGVGVFGFSYGGICAARASIFESAAQDATVCLSGGAKRSPAKDSHDGMPPVLLLWGNEDCSEDIEFADFWYRKMVNRGLEMTYHVFDGGMSNPHTKVYETYPCSQEWATDFLDEKLGVTLAAPTTPAPTEPTTPAPTEPPTPAPTAPPTPAPTEAPTAPLEYALLATHHLCSEGSANTVADEAACIAQAEAGGFQYYSYRGYDTKCKTTSTCTLTAKNHWNVYELGR